MTSSTARKYNLISRLLPPDHVLSNNSYVYYYYSYSIVFPISYLFTSASIQEYGAAILTQLIFTVAYLHSFWIRSSWLLIHFFLIASLSFIWININLIAIIYYFYCPYIVLYSNLKYVKTPLLFLVVSISTIQLYYIIEDTSGTLLFFTLMCVNIFAEHYRLKQQLNSHKLQLSNEEIEQLARYAERNKIAQDLHDALGQKLVAHILRMELAKEKSDVLNSTITTSDLSLWINSARDIMATARSVAHRTYQYGIGHEFKEVKSQLESLGMTAYVSTNVQDLTPQIENLLIMIVKECISNIIKHAKATEVHIDLRLEGHSLILTVSDNGIGYSRKQGFGMLGIRERVNKLEGQVSFSNSSGACMRAIIPLPREIDHES